MSKNTSTAKRVLIILNVLLLLGLAGATGFLFMENRDLNDQLTLTNDEKNKRLVEEINKVYKLPDEEPVVAIVTNPDEFKTQYPTFVDAKQGDYLLFFRKARLNVLYRQDEKRVVQTANVVVPIAVEVIGTQEAVDSASEKLAQFGNQISITKTVKDGVTQSFIFDVSADQAQETTSIAELLGVDPAVNLPDTIRPAEATEIVLVVTTTPVE